MDRRRLVVAVLALVAIAAVILGVWAALPDTASPPGAATTSATTQSATTSATTQPVATHPVDAFPVRIAAAGDTGTGGEDAYRVADEMAGQSRDEPYDALLLLGDLIYDDGDASAVDSRILEPFSAVLDDGAELVPVLGNHDYRSDEEEQILAELGRENRWYVEEVGPVRVIVLDSNLPDEPAQTQWLEETLAAPVPEGTWTVVAMHHPAFSSGEHGSTEWIREDWVPLFEEYDVPLVLAGHDHDYERTEPQNGVTYVVSGAGAMTTEVGHESFTAVSASTLQYLDLTFHTDEIVGRSLGPDGDLVDSFTIGR